MTVLGLYFVSADHHTRILAPYHLLQRSGNPLSSNVLTLSLVDRLPFPAIFMAWRTRAYSAALSAVISILVTFVAVATATLFIEMPAPQQRPFQIQQEEWFASFGPRVYTSNYHGFLTNNESSISYSTGLYNTWLYPAVTAPRRPEYDSGNMTISVRVPAMRPAMNCTRFPSETLRWSFDSSGHGNLTFHSPAHTPYWNAADCTPTSEIHRIKTDFTSGFVNLYENNCWTSVSGWGAYDNTTDSISWLTLYGCRDYVEEFDLNLNLHWPSLRLNRAIPPEPIESSARATTRVWAPSDILWYEYDPGTVVIPDTEYLLDVEDFVIPKGSKKYNLDPAWIQDPAREEAIWEAQQDWWKRRLAMVLSLQLRRNYNQPANITETDSYYFDKVYHMNPYYPDYINGPWNATKPPPFNATITDWNARRIVQQKIPSFLLIGLLSFVLVLNIASTLLSLHQK